MRDGYYLSTCLHIDELSHVLNMSQRHDQNLSLWKKEGKKVKLVHHWELERVSGIKNHNIAFYSVNQAKETINTLLKKYNLTIDDMLEIWGTPQLQSNDSYHSLHEYPDYTYHGVAHLFSAIMLDTDKFYNDNILGFAVDGGPDRVVDLDAWNKRMYVGCVVKKGEIELFSISSPGPLWFLSRYYLKLREGSLMALASASRSKGKMPIEFNKEISTFEDIMELNSWYENMVNGFDSAKQGEALDDLDARFSVNDNIISMVMKNIQRISIQIIEKSIEGIIAKYNIDPLATHLAFSGGYALNCPSNSHIMNKYNFKSFMAPPCVNDGGLSIGMALYVFYKGGEKINFKFENAYYGDDDDGLDELLKNNHFNSYIKSVAKINYDKFVDDIKKEPVVWFNGRAEIGPRALGNRSILADPGTEDSKNRLNIIKKRQWWRPVAPVILREYIGEWFEDAYPSPFMLNTFKIKDEKLALIPAVSHLDASARVQTLDKNDNALLYEVIEEFGKHTGIPMLCNTSLNDAGEPIINKIEEAMNFALRKMINIMYVNGYRIELCNFEKFKENCPHERPIKIIKYKDESERAKELKKLNPHGLSKDYLSAYYSMHELYSNYSLKKKKDVDTIKRIIELLIKSGKMSLDVFSMEI